MAPKRRSAAAALKAGGKAYDAGDWEAAIREYSAVLSLEPAHPSAALLRMRIADAHFACGAWQPAVSAYTPALTTDAGYSAAHAYAHRASAQRRLQQHRA